MESILYVVLPALLLAYYLKTLATPLKDHPLLSAALVGGVCLYYAGLLFGLTEPVLKTLLQLSGACLFFTGVAVRTLRRPRSDTPVTRPEPGEAINPSKPGQPVDKQPS
jgi:hypothetical protein